jgi:hypothetical protein
MTLEEFIERERVHCQAFGMTQAQINFMMLAIESAWLRGGVEAMEKIAGSLD